MDSDTSNLVAIVHPSQETSERDHADGTNINEISRKHLSDFPTELLQIIFLFVVVHPWTDCTPESTAAPWSLSQVCSRWRSIVLKTPVLWSSLYIPSDQRPDMVQCALTRSAAHGLVIHAGDKSSPLRNENFNLIASHLARWEEVTLSLPALDNFVICGTADTLRHLTLFLSRLSEDESPLDAEMIHEESLLLDSASNLEVIEVKDDSYAGFNLEPDEDDWVPSTVTLRSAPNLRHFHDRRVYVEDSMLEEYDRILENCQKLETFEVLCHHKFTPRLMLAPVVSSITKLVCFFPPLIDAVTAPQLREFHARCFLDMLYNFLSPLRAMLLRSCCTLTSLQLHNVSLGPSGMLVETLKAVPSLEILSIVFINEWTDSVTNALRGLFREMTGSTPVGFLPSLADMSLRVWLTFDIDDSAPVDVLDETFLAMVHSRAGAMDAVWACVNVKSTNELDRRELQVDSLLSQSDRDALRAYNASEDSSSVHIEINITGRRREGDVDADVVLLVEGRLPPVEGRGIPIDWDPRFLN